MLSLRLANQVIGLRAGVLCKSGGHLENAKCLSFYSNRIRKLKNEQKARLQNKREDLRIKLKEKETLVKQKLEGLRENIFTVPNGLTSSRIVMTPFIGYFILNGHHHLALCTFTVAGITDLVSARIRFAFTAHLEKN